MAILTILVPREAANTLSRISIPGDPESPGDYHITMVYLGEEISTEDLAKVLVATHDAVKGTKPFRVRVESVSSFPKGDDGVPIICPIVSPEIHALRESILVALDAAGIHYDTKFPEFKPHVTLAYDKVGDSFRERPIQPIEWEVNEIVLWGGDEGSSGVTMTIPFEISNEQTDGGRSVEAVYRKNRLRNTYTPFPRYKRNPQHYREDDEWEGYSDDKKLDKIIKELHRIPNALEGYLNAFDLYGIQDWSKKIKSVLYPYRKQLAEYPRQHGYGAFSKQPIVKKATDLLERIRRDFQVKSAEELKKRLQEDFIKDTLRDLRTYQSKDWTVEQMDLPSMTTKGPEAIYVILEHKDTIGDVDVRATISYRPWRIERKSEEARLAVYVRPKGGGAQRQKTIVEAKSFDVEHLKRLAEASIDRWLKTKANPPSKPTTPSTKGNSELLDKLKKLEEAAAAKGDKWTTDFAKSLYTQVSRGKTLSDKQNLYMERGFKRYKVSSWTLAQRIVSRFIAK